MEVRYYSPFSVDCTALYWIKMWNGTAWNDFEEYELYSQPAYENCEIKLQMNAVSGTQYQFWLKFDNYMKWEVDWSKEFSDTVNDTIARICDPLNISYVVPIVETTVLPNDTLGKYCYQAKDDQYWIGSYYEDSQSVNVAGPYASYLQEMRFYRPALANRYAWLTIEQDVLPQVSLISQIWTWVQSLFGWTQQTQNQVVMQSMGG
jgi:hypothetical protein